MLGKYGSTAVQLGALLSGAIALGGMVFAARVWKAQRSPFDFAYAICMAGWLAYLVAASLEAGADAFNQVLSFVRHAGYQVFVAGVTFFLLATVSATRINLHWLWIVQGTAGLLLLSAGSGYAFLAPEPAYRLWGVLNLVFATFLTLYLGLSLYLYLGRDGGYRRYLAFGASLQGLGISCDYFLLSDNLRAGPTPVQFAYVFCLHMVWLLITQRIRVFPPAFLASTGEAASPHAPSGATSLQFFQGTDSSAQAVNEERRRIAQDLHDGVGSQLVNVLATLDPRVPDQRELALALEQCLLDLKIMVDSIESTEGCILDALGRLRYRVQPALDKLGIQMAWTVDVEGPLQDFCGDRARQVLRMTQEILSNIMRHAHASEVQVMCRYQAESGSLQLEVQDNGCGMALQEAGLPTGKGLEGLRRRAGKLGGHLEIVTGAKIGTCIRLQVPLHEPDGPKA